jgi:hypothetical protein
MKRLLLSAAILTALAMLPGRSYGQVVGVTVCGKTVGLGVGYSGTGVGFAPVGYAPVGYAPIGAAPFGASCCGHPAGFTSGGVGYASGGVGFVPMGYATGGVGYASGGVGFVPLGYAAGGGGVGFGTNIDLNALTPLVPRTNPNTQSPATNDDIKNILKILYRANKGNAAIIQGIPDPDATGATGSRPVGAIDRRSTEMQTVSAELDRLLVNQKQAVATGR